MDWKDQTARWAAMREQATKNKQLGLDGMHLRRKRLKKGQTINAAACVKEEGIQANTSLARRVKRAISGEKAANRTAVSQATMFRRGSLEQGNY